MASDRKSSSEGRPSGSSNAIAGCAASARSECDCEGQRESCDRPSLISRFLPSLKKVISGDIAIGALNQERHGIGSRKEIAAFKTTNRWLGQIKKVGRLFCGPTASFAPFKEVHTLKYTLNECIRKANFIRLVPYRENPFPSKCWNGEKGQTATAGNVHPSMAQISPSNSRAAGG